MLRYGPPSGSPPKLPSIDSFRLNNIINDVENSKEIRQEIAESILQINTNYTKDLDEQIESIREIEKGEIVNRLENVMEKYERLNTEAPRRVEERKELLEGLANDMEVINEGIGRSTRRLKDIVKRLKLLEGSVSVRDKLFHLRSPNKEHYKELYGYGMKEEIRKEEKRREEEEERRRREQEKVEVGTSPLKLQQYMNVEREIDELKRSKVGKFKNPTKLTAIESPTTEVSDEVAIGERVNEGGRVSSELRRLAESERNDE